MFDKSGFGSVGGNLDLGLIENLSTQAVMELIRNVRCDEDGPGVVQIDALDIENFNINRSNSHGNIRSHDHGKLFAILQTELNV